MAIMHIHKEVLQDTFLFDMVADFFTKITELPSKQDNIAVLEVEGDEIPENAGEIELLCYKFLGINPFIIGVNVLSHTNQHP